MPDCWFSFSALLRPTALAMVTKMNVHLLLQLPASVVLWLQLTWTNPFGAAATRVTQANMPGSAQGQPRPTGFPDNSPHPAQEIWGHSRGRWHSPALHLCWLSWLQCQQNGQPQQAPCALAAPHIGLMATGQGKDRQRHRAKAVTCAQTAPSHQEGGW